ncbi:MAG TPA: hypothetical protein VD996_09055 [Chitinophagaceae bacterium]|nr:hypothetical protein [Chitinophagaceae bacterium]
MRSFVFAATLFAALFLLFACKKETTPDKPVVEGLSVQSASSPSGSSRESSEVLSIEEYYSEIGRKHNESLTILHEQFYYNDKASPEELALPIIETSLDYVKKFSNASAYFDDGTYIDRAKVDVIETLLNNKPVDLSGCSDQLMEHYTKLRDLVLTSEYEEAEKLTALVDGYYFETYREFKDSVDLISFTAFAGTLKASLQFWFADGRTERSGTSAVMARRPPDKKGIAVADGVGALKGAWEFGRLGFALGGGAGAFVVGATGAIFEGAIASAEAGLLDRIGSWTGWW